jgi:uncharacterized damage-inducible protein DinB
MINELQREAATTRRVLERVPVDRFSFQPHAKAMTLGQLAMHIASIPGNLSKLAQVDEFEASNANFTSPMPKDIQEVLTTLDSGVADAKAYLAGLSEQNLESQWRMTMHGKQVFAVPRQDFLRNVMFNHWYHHRGQLSTYLRFLDIPVPSIYGPSADENPFA